MIEDRAARPWDLQEPMNKPEIGKCTFTNCSIGISLDEDHLGGEVNPESGKVVVRVDEESGQVVQSPGTPKSLKVDGCDKRPEKTNLLCDVTNCTFETGFYGVMNQSRKTRLMVEVTSKSDKKSLRRYVAIHSKQM